MSISKQKEISNTKEEKKYPTERLLRSKHLAEYQQDFAKVLLTEKNYTIAEAKGILNRALKGGK